MLSLYQLIPFSFITNDFTYLADLLGLLIAAKTQRSLEKDNNDKSYVVTFFVSLYSLQALASMKVDQYLPSLFLRLHTGLPFMYAAFWTAIAPF